MSGFEKCRWILQTSQEACKSIIMIVVGIPMIRIQRGLQDVASQVLMIICTPMVEA